MELTNGDDDAAPKPFFLQKPTPYNLSHRPVLSLDTRTPVNKFEERERDKSRYSTIQAAGVMASATEPTIKSVEVQKKEEEEDDSAAVTGADDEDTGAQVAPIVQLKEVAVTTGEESEDVLLDLKAKLYRFDKEGNQWKERGAGTVKLLKHKETGRVRLVMRQSKTLKICANHFVPPSINLQEHAGNEKSCVWQAVDFADGELKNETFCIRFASAENCKSFREKVDEVAESQAPPAAETEEGNAAANLIASLSVGSDDQVKKTEAKEEETSAATEVKDENEEKEKPADEK